MVDMFDLIGETANTEQSLLLIMQGGTVKRFHTVDTIHANNNGHHQWGTAMLAYLLAERKPSLNLIMACLTHDLGEKAYGDIPAPSKRALGLRATINDLEEKFLKDNHVSFELTGEEHTILKLADIMDGLLYCISERMLGNRNIDVVYNRFRGYAHSELTLNAHCKLVLLNVDELWEDCVGAR